MDLRTWTDEPRDVRALRALYRERERLRDMQRNEGRKLKASFAIHGGELIDLTDPV
jgi:hypothetical protein